MTFDEEALVVANGPGLVGRWPGVVLLVCGSKWRSPVADQLIATCRAASTANHAPGVELIRSVARMILTADRADSPDFALAARTDVATAVMAHRDASVTTVGNSGTTLTAGWEAATWVDRIIDEDVRTIVLATRDSPDFPESTHLNLQLGVVVGSAARLGTARPSDIAWRVPESLAAGGVPSAPVLTDGNAHPADSLSPASTSAGRSIRGVLVVGEGTEYPLDQDLVMGRDPWDDERVRAGTATAVVLDDPERSVSRIHALLRIVGDQVVLVDCGSTNGTSIARPGASGWTAVTNHGSVVLESGTRVLLGQRTALFETTAERNYSS
jgi:hypothetical protein